MTTDISISRRGLQAAVAAFFIALMLPIVAKAQTTPWDGVTIAAPEGSGTKDDPYLISSGANLKYLFDNTSLWNSDLYFRQTADIDLADIPLKGTKTYSSIGYGSSVAATNKAGTTAFRGNYDGAGFKITRLKVEVGSISNNAAMSNLSFGLFGYIIGGSVRNLSIENSVILFPSGFTIASDLDLKVGFVCGVAGANTIIENVCVLGSRIATESDIVIGSAFVGGVIGDVASEYAGYDSMYNDGGYLRNIVSDVDIDFMNVTRASGLADAKKTQFNVGGIVGRLRRCDVNNLPDYVVYTGRIVAPYATVSSTWGLSRANAVFTLTSVMEAYSGEYCTSSSSTNYTHLGKSASSIYYIHAADNRYFYDYEVYNPLTDEVETMTASYPEERKFQTHTINALGTGTTNFDYSNLNHVAMFQGYNHATAADKDNASDRQAMLDMLNGYVSASSNVLKSWDYDAVRGVFCFSDKSDMAINRDLAEQFTVNVTRLPSSVTGFKIEWIGNGSTLIETTDLILNELGGYSVLTVSSPEIYTTITAYLCDGSGNRIVQRGEEVFTTHTLAPLRDFLPVELVKVPFTDGDGTQKFYYIATARNKDGSIFAGGGDMSGEYISQPDYAWLWEVTSDPSSESSWEGTDLHFWYEHETGAFHKNWIIPYVENRYYRAMLCKLRVDEDGNYLYATDDHGNYITDSQGHRKHLYDIVSSDALGPRNIIYVYDKRKSSFGYEQKITAFDGLDRSYVELPEFPDGSDANTGFSPYYAVKTIKRAYELIDPALGTDGNVIVIMGYYFDDTDSGELPTWGFSFEDLYEGPATITGNRGEIIFDGVLNMETVSDNSPLSFNGHTVFSEITWCGYNNPYAINELGKYILLKSKVYIQTNLYDFTIGSNVKVINYTQYPEKNGLIDNTKAPHISISTGIHNYAGGELPVREGGIEPGVTTLNVNSANIGRIIACSRNTQLNSGNNIFGLPDHPHRVKVNVGITHSSRKSETDRFVPRDYCDQDYNYDVALLVGGQTDGSVYAETEIYMNDGYVGRYISGNISYGRATNANNPSDSFFGSTTLTLESGEITELYGGSLGRHSTGVNGTTSCEAYFYGQSVINIKGGNIRSDIYGAGAGGVTGVGDDFFHTDDENIPYYNAVGKLVYGTYQNVLDAGGTDRVATLLMRDGSRLSFTKSHCEVNILGGTIQGNVYGGGFGYSSQTGYEKATSLAGNLYGTVKVTMQKGMPVTPMVVGDIFGCGGGSDAYYLAAIKAGMDPEEAMAKFSQLGCLYGDASVELYAGVVKGDVYGGAAGVEGFDQMAEVRGNTSVVIDGATVEGNIYGGSNFADIRRHPGIADPTLSGNTSIRIESGTIGNNIFGASHGTEDVESGVEGSTSVVILGGSYINDPYLRDPEGLVAGQRTFNIYGGGYTNSIVGGDSKVYIEQALLKSENSIVRPEDNPNHPESYANTFDAAFQDITLRRYCVYGGGYGEKARVNGNADVTINIIGDATGGVVMPTEEEVTTLQPGQTFFDVSGGGYSGAVGYWADADGTPVYTKTDPVLADYHHYVNGDVSVTVKGSPRIRKVIGGGFYSEVNNASTRIESGSIGSVYGGSLMGYVHKAARLEVGSSLDHFKHAPDSAAICNSRLFILDAVYGGNDVKGIVGTTFWYDDFYNNAYLEDTDGAPLFTAETSFDQKKGSNIFIYGGTVKGNVYGAGNGYYRGYYVPEWTRYNDGPDRQYRKVRSSINPSKLDRVYRSRPMVGCVFMHVGGNSEADRVNIRGNLYGGGRSCTIGAWNTILPFEDPRRLVKGGNLHVNFGDHVTVGGNVYMGVQGDNYNKQNLLADPSINLSTFDGTTSAQLNRLGDIAYDHWYLDTDAGCYLPGFPPPGKVDGNYGMTGEHMFRGYLKNIEMNGDVVLTFYSDIFQRDTDTKEYLHDSDGDLIRRPWVPGEAGLSYYDSRDVVFSNFYFGGQCGSMTNNARMRYDYTDHSPYSEETTPPSGHDIERYGSIYRVVIPKGVKILDKVVGGSEDAVTKVYAYANNYTEVPTVGADNNPIEPLYTFKGGVVTQTDLTYDLIVYNDKHGGHDSSIPASTYMHLNPGDEGYDTYTLKDGTVIHRYNYSSSNPCIPNNRNIDKDLYSLAVIHDGKGGLIGYSGEREGRKGATVLKLTCAADFAPFTKVTANVGEIDEHEQHYGGIIYGGCFNSGITMGDVIINAVSDMTGGHVDPNDREGFLELSSLRHNVSRVFGGGYGLESLIDGNTFINLLDNFVGMNVFGGGCRGDVTGKATINYIGNEYLSFVYGSIYGGGLYGSVGSQDINTEATELNLISGNAGKVYGGSCLGNLYGRTQVNLYDQIVTELDHLDYDRYKFYNQTEGWGGSRLIVGSVFGGNDVAGFIHLPELDPTDPDYDVNKTYSTTVYVYEEPEEEQHRDPEKEPVGPGKDTPGASNGYNGFPLIGSLYGGSNGDYGSHDSNEEYYDGGVLRLAVGSGSQVMNLKLGGDPERGYDAFSVPHVERSRVIIKGGTVIDAYGGGNRSTINQADEITIDYNEDNLSARAGFHTEDETKRIWNVLQLASDEQFNEVITRNDDGEYIFDYQVYRVFGGNNNSTMSIQPTWDLTRGYVGNVYSGGNLGRMTYFDYDAEGKAKGLYLGIDSRDFHAGAVYGGGRIGDIDPDVPQTNPNDPTKPAIDDDFYGATLEIFDGVIDHVYGGNDVSGNVFHGTKVMIHGAISGDVYCAGNGNYRYKYDPDLDPSSSILERYDDNIGGRYFVLPRRDIYGGTGPWEAQRLLAINSYRPNVDRTYMMIEGKPDRPAYVRGSVYCGGNASTVHESTNPLLKNDIVFNVGDNVILNGVFLGSNGENLTRDEAISAIETLNDIHLIKTNDLTETQAEALRSDPKAKRDADAYDRKYYQTMLDIYMRAVEVTALPNDFEISDDLTNVYIGDFFIGGNRGSMMTDQNIHLSFPESLTIYGKIVGGSNNACFNFNGVHHAGGLLKPVDETLESREKVHLDIRCKFEPWKLHYPLDNDFRKIELMADVEEIDGKTYFPETKCMVYGGCYSSGKTVGDIGIDLYSSMVSEYKSGSAIATALAPYGIGSTKTMKRVIVDGINDFSRRSFAIVGGGYGMESSVNGNIRVRMLPGKLHPKYREGISAPKPSCAALFGGSLRGEILGNTTLEVRDGMVLTNMYGASEAAEMFGSTQTVIGWPEYYVCDVQRTYKLDRKDKDSKAAREHWVNEDDPERRKAIIDEISLRVGELVSIPVYNLIADADKASCFTLVANDKPENFSAVHKEIAYRSGLTWDDIDISIGHSRSRNDDDAEYYGHGNVYGGGFISNSSTISLAGKSTVKKFRAINAPDPSAVGFGGNSMIMIWDNKENSDTEREVGGEAGNGAGTGGVVIRDHLTIGTGHFVEQPPMRPGQDIIGKYIYDSSVGRYIHQSPHVLTADDPLLNEKFYAVESDGGIYGGGRKVYVEGFRSCDLSYYGYAENSPQYPKLLNTVQRLDLLSVTDCCMHLEGACDFSTNGVDATKYSMTRIGELQMNSSIPSDANLNPGVRQTTGLFNVQHATPRTRNYLALFNDVLYLAAVTTNEPFTSDYRGANGVRFATGDFGPNSSSVDIPPGFSIDDYEYTSLPSQFSYSNYKGACIDNYYANCQLPMEDGSSNPLVNNQTMRAKTSLEFDQRNVGTAANMIGINNGYTLKIQGVVNDAAGDEVIYYGPITGVAEVKLMTLAQNEGGGYIFALNQHDDPNHFLETTGNFVFPGAAYVTIDNEDKNYNYIYDDCFPMGMGWESYYGWEGSSSSMGPGSSRHSMAPSHVSKKDVDSGHGDCNELQDVHYWYVNGTSYYYNVTLTAVTYNSATNFSLDNSDQLIYLYGIEPGMDLKVTNVVWDDTTNIDSDIQNIDTTDGVYEKDYRLYLSVDKNAANVHTTDAGSEYLSHSFVTPIPRGNYDESASPTTLDLLADPADAVNNYSDFSATDHNMPLLGISLVDAVDNTTKAYYDQHLKDPEKVRIELHGTKDGSEYTYVVNLTVRYLLGPSITGFPQIENCALPGEYIYVNSFGMTVELDDDNMAITERNWYIVSPEYDPEDTKGFHDLIAGIDNPDPTKRKIGEKLEHEKFDGDRQAHIPAYMYRNGWNIIYQIVANNIPFYFRPDKNPDATADDPHYSKHLVVHNYHRMRPYDGVSIKLDQNGVPVLDTDNNTQPMLEELNITAGARIYIEDDNDMAYFFKWLRDRQSAPTRVTPAGEHIDPQYGDSLYIFLMNDVKMPPLDMSKVSDLKFCGTFHGNGHNIDMGTNLMFLGENAGLFYNTGFVSRLGNGDATVFGKNTKRLGPSDELLGGKIENCFLYNAENHRRGIFIDASGSDRGMVVNCYNSADNDSKNVGEDLIDGSDDMFQYGNVAYDLNRFYLMERYNRGSSLPDDDFVKPINWMFRDGSYRFARFNTAGGDPTALRTMERPNYHDYRGIRISVTADNYGPVTGADATNHDCNDWPDNDRLLTDGNGDPVLGADGEPTYQPLFPKDFLFFGEALSYANTDKAYPQSLTDDNRVYRASGFYGDKIDRGFHFNIDAEALHPQLTAIDFTGLRDAQHSNAYVVENANYADQQGFYTPMLDMPEGGVRSFTTFSRLIDEMPWMNAGSDTITRNLLVYTAPDEKFDIYDYIPSTQQEKIFCHVINPSFDAGGNLQKDVRPTKRLFHLVDLQNFNCPIEFEVSDSTWYQRIPGVFSNGRDGWEGLCLPFTVETVYGTVSSTEVNPLRDHRDLSHFYGPHKGLDVEEPSHEYWLRKFTGCDGENLYFDRPASEDDVASGNPAETKRDYFYSNTFFSDVYGKVYGDGTTHARDQYTPVGVTYADYPMITESRPYIAAFPGKKFYEFDLSGEFYAEKFPGAKAVKQNITYVTKGANVIKVTDDNPPVGFTHDGYTVKGTYMRFTTDAYTGVIDAQDNNGSFIRPYDSAARRVEPFRVYVTMPASRSHGMPISTRFRDAIGDGDDEGDDSEDGDEMSGLEILVDMNELVVRSPYENDFELPLFDVNGRIVRYLNIVNGENRYRDLSPGYYLLRHTKFRIQ